MEVSKQVAHETYAPIEGKQVEIFADDSTQAAKILVQENNILYVWNLTCGMQEAKQFADTLAWPVPEAKHHKGIKIAAFPRNPLDWDWTFPIFLV